jgi:chemotaxis protein MotB
MRRGLLKMLMVVLVLIPVGLTAYLANNLYHRKGVPEALQSLTTQLFQSKAEESKAEKRAEVLEKKATELQKAYDSLVADLHGEVDAREIRVRRFREKLEINFVDKVLFASGSAEITPRGREILTKVAGVLVKLGDKSIYVAGHTDDKPIHSALFPSNWELSTSRAAAVIRFLSESGSVPPERFTAMGRAFYQPVASNATPEGRQENRRVDIIVTEAPIFGDGSKAPEAQTGTGGTAVPSADTAGAEAGAAVGPERTLPDESPAGPSGTTSDKTTGAPPAKEPSSPPAPAPVVTPEAPQPTGAPGVAQPSAAPGDSGQAPAPSQEGPATPSPLPPVLPDRSGAPGAGS